MEVLQSDELRLRSHVDELHLEGRERERVLAHVDQLDLERHLSDLAVLFSLVTDSFHLREELGPRNARRIAAVRALDNDEHEAWRRLPQPQRLEAITARALIVATT